jgi:cation diffusion facilitator family transporter
LTARHGDNFRTGRRVAIAGLAASALLASLNVVVGIVAHSTSVLALGVEFAFDVIASSIVLIGLTVGARPADAEHPYGHGRIEMLAGFFVGVMVFAGGGAICYYSLRSIGMAHVPPGPAAVAGLLVAIVLRGVLFVVKVRVGRRIGSASLVADAWNDAVDILSALAALTAVGLTLWDPDRFLSADRYGGFVVGVIVIATGIRIIRETSLELVDTMPDAAAADQLRRIAATVPGVIGLEKVYARKTGLQYHVDLHIQVDPALTVAASHAIAGHVRATIRQTLPWVADVLVHIEPAGVRRPGL